MPHPAARAWDINQSDIELIAWLYLIARNNLRPIQRRQRRFQFLSIDRLLRTISASFPALHQRDVALDAGDHDLIQQTLNQLVPGLREALLLRSVGGFTGHEVSQILDVSPAAARKRISRAEHGAHRKSTAGNTVPAAGQHGD
ncbi:MAG TPA: sigma factor-like helix-turn-helix DNA-binding protein [Nitrolancea sp.]